MPNIFETAVINTPDIRTCCQKGLSALGKYSAKIKCKESLCLDGSVDIDACTCKLYPDGSRWDYALSYKSKVYFIEFHTASSGEVSRVVKKLKWLKDWLIANAPELYRLKSRDPYHWIQSNGFHIPKSSKHYRLASQNGIIPKKMIDLDMLI